MPRSEDRAPDGHTHRWTDLMWVPAARGPMRVMCLCGICKVQITRNATAKELKEGKLRPPAR
ncbi:MAG TPA: hypothetical protein VM536_16155 [Chloroflexia bacterium]|nr:hypothetical protein [Chloroflexia bacterium]